jgi:APA family basic amino acid/polyamine antiporter
MFPLYALTGATFLQAMIPGLPKLPVAVLLLAVFFLTNLLGAKIAIWVQAILVGVLLLALFSFVGAGIPHISLQNHSPLFPGGNSWADSSLSMIAAAFLQGPLFVFFIVGGGFLAVITTLNSTYLWGTKSLILI